MGGSSSATGQFFTTGHVHRFELNGDAEYISMSDTYMLCNYEYIMNFYYHWQDVTWRVYQDDSQRVEVATCKDVSWNVVQCITCCRVQD